MTTNENVVQSNEVGATHEPELFEGVYRTARTRWECRCPGNGHENCTHANCVQTIEPGTRYVEYPDEGAYQSGTRYCLPCGVTTWAADRWVDGRYLG